MDFHAEAQRAVEDISFAVDSVVVEQVWEMCDVTGVIQRWLNLKYKYVIQWFSIKSRDAE